LILLPEETSHPLRPRGEHLARCPQRSQHAPLSFAVDIGRADERIGASLPALSRQHEIFLVYREAVSWITSGGTSRNAGSKCGPACGTGHSVRPAFSIDQARILESVHQARLCRQRFSGAAFE
jgi:hypothetical protein